MHWYAAGCKPKISTSWCPLQNLKEHHSFIQQQVPVEVHHLVVTLEASSESPDKASLTTKNSEPFGSKIGADALPAKRRQKACCSLLAHLVSLCKIIPCRRTKPASSQRICLCCSEIYLQGTIQPREASDVSTADESAHTAASHFLHAAAPQRQSRSAANRQGCTWSHADIQADCC